MQRIFHKQRQRKFLARRYEGGVGRQQHDLTARHQRRAPRHAKMVGELLVDHPGEVVLRQHALPGAAALRGQRVAGQAREGRAHHHVEAAFVLQQGIQRLFEPRADGAHAEPHGAARLNAVLDLLLRFGAACEHGQCGDIVLDKTRGDGRKFLAHGVADDDHAPAAQFGQGVAIGAVQQLALGDGAIELQSAGGVKGLSTGDIVGQVEHAGQADLFIGGHFVQMQAVENARFDPLGRFRHGLVSEERSGRINERAQEVRGLFGAQQAAAQQAIDQLLG